MTSSRNTELLDMDADSYVSQELSRVKSLDLDSSQLESAKVVFSSSYDLMRENAVKQKSKQIGKKAGANNLMYYSVKKQIDFEKILTKDQLQQYRLFPMGVLNDKQLAKHKKDLMKMGYSFE